MTNINYAVAEGKKRSMAPFAYDENGWPSGFADGRVPALGERDMCKMALPDKWRV